LLALVYILHLVTFSHSLKTPAPSLLPCFFLAGGQTPGALKETLMTAATPLLTLKTKTRTAAAWLKLPPAMMTRERTRELLKS
jgi:hypothetical protein